MNNINNKTNIEDFLKIIEFFIDKIEVENEIKSFFLEYLEKIENKDELKNFVDFLEKTYINQELVKQDEQYQKELKKIDDETFDEINNILNK